MSRLALALGSLGVLVADGALWSAAFARGDVASAVLRLYPERLDGQQVVLTLVDVVALGEGSYEILDDGVAYTVIGDPAGLVVGGEIYVGGRLEAGPRRIHEAWREPAPDRFAKKVYGFLGMALAAAGLPLWFRVGRQGVALRG